MLSRNNWWRICYREKAVKAGTLQTARSDEKAAAVNQAGGFFENGKLTALADRKDSFVNA